MVEFSLRESLFTAQRRMLPLLLPVCDRKPQGVADFIQRWLGIAKLKAALCTGDTEIIGQGLGFGAGLPGQVDDAGCNTGDNLSQA
jgi:hypothetical protein